VYMEDSTGESVGEARRLKSVNVRFNRGECRRGQEIEEC